MPITPSPLRYPGGKTQLYPVLREILGANNMASTSYVEPFAGGCGLALKLLFKGDVERIVLNDFDLAIYAFWFSILNYTTDFCKLLEQVPVDVNEWQKQKDIYNALDATDMLSLGFATFFLNRANISGVIKGGIIGGKEQKGNFKIDARFNKDGLIKRILKISEYKDSIALHNLDAIDFINTILPVVQNPFVNFDPPYVKKGSLLYKNSYSELDHRTLASKVVACSIPWIVTYDICELVKSLYSQFRHTTLGINYSIGDVRDAKEYIFFSDNLALPKILS